MIHVTDAITACERQGFIAERTEPGRRLTIYGPDAGTGEMREIGSTMIDGADCVARHALRRIFGEDTANG